MKTNDRVPAVAGLFYEGDSARLERQLQKLFSKAIASSVDEEVAALLVPHAGYVYSGGVAASAFNQISPEAEYERVFLIGSSHRMSFPGGSVYTKGDYFTPLGRVETDLVVAQSLVEGSDYFIDDVSAHIQEHSLEVQLPFLQYHLKNDFKLVPIILGTRDPEVCKKIAGVLKPWFNSNNLFVISTDFSHYPSYEDAQKVDASTLAAILDNKPRRLLKVLDENMNKGIPGLATCLCGWSSVLTLLHLTRGDEVFSYRHLEYKNSGDSPIGDTDRVVGYHAVGVFRQCTEESGKELKLTESEKEWLLKRARKALRVAVMHRSPPKPEEPVSGNLAMPLGGFVSLYIKGELRGCVGCLEERFPLWEVVDRMTFSAAMTDSRFMPLSTEEVDQVLIEISVLTPKRRVKDVSEIVPGIHGVVVEKNGRIGTFLPQVASRNGWSVETLLGYCARDKAHIGWDGWKNADVYVYEAIVFGEKPLQ